MDGDDCGSCHPAEAWLSGEGFSKLQITNIGAALSSEGVAPEDWLTTLHGLERVDLDRVAGSSGRPESPAPAPEAAAGAGSDLAHERLEPMNGVLFVEQEEEEEGSGLERMVTARTDEFLNHGKREAEKYARRRTLHTDRVEQYGHGAVTLGQSVRFECGSADTIGRRRTMEDVMTIHGCFRGSQEEDFFGVFDGHGSQSVAEYVAMHISASMQEAIAPLGPLPSPEQLSAASTAAYRHLNGQLDAALAEVIGPNGPCPSSSCMQHIEPKPTAFTYSCTVLFVARMRTSRGAPG